MPVLGNSAQPDNNLSLYALLPTVLPHLSLSLRAVQVTTCMEAFTVHPWKYHIALFTDLTPRLPPDSSRPWTDADSTNLLESLVPSAFSASVTESWTSQRSENITSNSSVSSHQIYYYNIVEKILIGITLSLIIVFAIFRNTLVVVAILTDRNLRTTSDYFIVSLAVADTLVALLVMSFAVANDITGYWVCGPVFCNVWLSFDVMCSTASILNLCAISFDRYLHIRSPLHYEQHMTVRRSIVGIAALWLLSALISFVPIHLGWHQLTLPSRDYTSTSSTTTSVQEAESGYAVTSNIVGKNIIPSEAYMFQLTLNRWYAVISSLVSFFAPCLLMVIFYFKLYQFARIHIKNIRRTWVPGTYTVAFPGSKQSTQPLSSGVEDLSRQGQYKMQDHKAAVTLGVIIGTFLLCWVPFFTINIVKAFCSHCIPPTVFAIFTWLGYLNSTMNPVIYSIFNAKFREAFKRVLAFKRCRIGTASHLRDSEFGKSSFRSKVTPSAVEYSAMSSSGQEHNWDKLMSDDVTSV